MEYSFSTASLDETDSVNVSNDEFRVDLQVRDTAEIGAELTRPKLSEFDSIVGESPAMLRLFELMMRIAPYFQRVLLTGPSGTGKDVLARALHELVPRDAGPFVVCDCPSIVESLFESELFGHTRGAFTGATQDRKGLIETARGGTLFLDEIGELPLSVQPKLLRMLQNREVRPVGSQAVVKTNVRIIAATNRNLADLVAKNEFRSDLYYRLKMLEIEVPALVERRSDIALIAQHFVRQFSQLYKKPIIGLTRRTQSVVMNYSWPGNVRELENVIGHACIMTDNGVIDLEHLPVYLRDAHERSVLHPASGGDAELIPILEVERRHAFRVLERVGQSKSRAAEVLGISRSTLYRLLQGSLKSNCSTDLSE